MTNEYFITQYLDLNTITIISKKKKKTTLINKTYKINI